MTVYDAALPTDSVTAGRKGCTGKQTCSRSLSEEAEDLPTKRCYYLYYQDYSVHKRLEDIKSLVDPVPWSYVTPGPCCQQGKSLCYCRFCRLWSHPILVIPLCRGLVCPTVPYAGAIPNLWASVTTLWCSSNLTPCLWRWRVGTRVRHPTPNQDTGHPSPTSNCHKHPFFCFVSALYPLCVLRLQMVRTESLCLDMDIQVLAQEAPSLVWNFMCFRGEWVNFVFFLRWLWRCVPTSSSSNISKSQVDPRSCFLSLLLSLIFFSPFVFEQSCLWSNKLQSH